MTVFPGFGGQAYIPDSTERVRQLRELVDANNPACEIEVDGGIDKKTIGPAPGPEPMSSWRARLSSVRRKGRPRR